MKESGQTFYKFNRFTINFYERALFINFSRKLVIGFNSLYNTTN